MFGKKRKRYKKTSPAQGRAGKIAMKKKIHRFISVPQI